MCTSVQTIVEFQSISDEIQSYIRWKNITVYLTFVLFVYFRYHYKVLLHLRAWMEHKNSKSTEMTDLQIDYPQPTLVSISWIYQLTKLMTSSKHTSWKPSKSVLKDLALLKNERKKNPLQLLLHTHPWNEFRLDRAP